MGGLDFASQFRDVGGFFSKRFSPEQRHQIDTNQADYTKCKQSQIGLKLLHSNFSWPGIP